MVNTRICLFLFRLTESLEAKLSLPSRSSSSLRLNFDLWRGILDLFHAPVVPSDRKTHVCCRRPSPVCSEKVNRNAARKLECIETVVEANMHCKYLWWDDYVLQFHSTITNLTAGAAFWIHWFTHTPSLAPHFPPPPPPPPPHVWLVFVRDREVPAVVCRSNARV